jgi:hypothetical protein
MLPWFGTLLTLGACGGVADLGPGAGAGELPEVENEAGRGGRATDPKSVPDDEPGGMSSDIGGTTSSGGSAATTAGSDVGGSPPNQYPGRGFVVHEWGTDTIVVGSDGSLQRGLHHEEEDLPSFVYDRIKAATLLGATPSPSVTIKMETPVTYFYSDVPRTVHAAVSFPKGVLTQWFPGVTSFLPPVAAPNSMVMNEPLTFADPVLDVAFPFVSDLCRTKFAAVGSGLLDWGSISVLGRDASVGAPFAPLDKFSWSYARDVASNPVQAANGETEHFLFYRGLGNFDLPVTVNVTGPGIAGLGDNPVTLKNGFSEAIGPVFMMNVAKDEAVFKQFPQGIAPGGELSDKLPMLYGTLPLDTYAEQLSAAVTGALDDTGLYHDEAVAMVNTWKRQWFRTPGQRLLYVIPQTWTDASIPLTIEPKPDTMLRVMLIRVEIITPEQEAEDVAALAGLDGKSNASLEHFTSLGRFAEPRLRRALALSPSAGGQDYLAQIATANTSVSSGE